jgi:hypothetical protein
VADFRSQSTPGAPARGAQKATGETLDPAEGKASELKQRARAEADAVGQQVRGAAEDIKREAAHAAEQTKEQVRLMAARQKQAAAGQVSGFAQALKGASGDLEHRGQPFAARCVEQAAEGLQRASDALEQRDFDELIGGVEDFARRQPVAFLGGAVLAGFGLARLMKSSAERRHGTGGGEFPPHARTVSGGAFPATSPGAAEAMGSTGPGPDIRGEAK